MLPLVLDVNVVKVWLPAESKTFSYVAHGHHHLLVHLYSLNIFNISINKLFVKLNVLKF